MTSNPANSPGRNRESLVAGGSAAESSAAGGSAAGGKRLRGPNDPDRKNRITRAAIAVVTDQGIDALSHRAVAARAGVPLGSTTYHFATLDDLLAEALAHAATASITGLRDWERNLPPDSDLASALARFVQRSLTEHREHTVVEYNLYVLALHRPHLRHIAAGWDQALAELFGSRTDPVTGRMIAALFCGLLMQAVLSDQQDSLAEIEALFRRALNGH